MAKTQAAPRCGLSTVAIFVLFAISSWGCGATSSPSSTGGTSTPPSSAALAAGNFSFTVTGKDSKTDSFAIAGSLTLDSSGNVTGGEQDYNSHGGSASPASGNIITGGKLTSGSNGIGTLTITTSNTALGAGGTETFSIVVVNNKHALISESDSAGTSSGSLDFQTLSSAGLAQLNGPFSFLIAGTTNSKEEIFGGNITFNGAGSLHIKVDQNRANAVTQGHTNIGTYTAPDGSGRGTMAFGGDTFTYYVVNGKVFRILVTTANNPHMGSAYAGVTGVSNAVLNTKFVFADSGTLWSSPFFSAGGLLPMDGNGHVTAGFADVDENGHATSAPLTGTYSVDGSGYGSIAFTSGDAQDISLLGLYLTDPTINFSDPNSPAGPTNAGLCGLLLNLDPKLEGSGVLILPGTTGTAPSGNFALGAQIADISGSGTTFGTALGVATISGSSVSGTEDLNDPANGGQKSAIAISGTLAPDSSNAGRFTLPATLNGGPSANYAIYQASSTQAIIVDIDAKQYGWGTLQQQH